MATTLTVDQHLDLLATTLEDLPRGEFEIAWDNQVHELSRVYTEDNMQIDGGTSIRRNIILNETGNARYRQMFDIDTPNVKPIHSQLDVPWALLDTSYSWEIFELKTQINSEKAYIDLVESRKTEAEWGLANLLEEKGWGTPADSSDNTSPFGIPYWISFQENAVTTAGFDGQTLRYSGGTTATLIGAIDAAVESKWRNYTGVYTVIDNGFLKILRRAFIETNFRPPVLVRNPRGQDGVGVRALLYCGLDEYVELQDLMDSRDDNTRPQEAMGGVLARIDGVLTVNGHPVVGIPQLTGGSGQTNVTDFNPFYFVDWTKLKPIVHSDYWMERTDPIRASNQHTVFSVYVDAAHNNLMTNRRTGGFVVHTVTS